MERVTLQAVSRPALGTGAAKRLRRQGLIPAVVYGKDHSNIQVSVNAREMVKLLHKTGEHVIFDLLVAESTGEEQPVIIKTMQFDTVKDKILHIDFQKITLTDAVRVTVPLVFQGEEECPAVKSGGRLEHIMREIEIESLPLQLPKQLTVDVSGLEIEGSVCVKDIQTPEGVQIIEDPEQAIMVAHMPAEEKTEESEASAEAEPQVLKQKQAETEK